MNIPLKLSPHKRSILGDKYSSVWRRLMYGTPAGAPVLHWRFFAHDWEWATFVRRAGPDESVLRSGKGEEYWVYTGRLRPVWYPAFWYLYRWVVVATLMYLALTLIGALTRLAVHDLPPLTVSRAPSLAL